MRNYSENTQELASDVINGIKVETSALANLTYMDASDRAIFTVLGRIKLNALYAEVYTAAGGQATTVQFKYEQTAPFAFGPTALCVVSVGTLNAAVKGTRAVLIGDAVGTACLIDAGPGISCYTYPMILGTGLATAVGKIQVDVGVANLSGTTIYVCYYTPLSDYAKVTPIA